MSPPPKNVTATMIAASQGSGPVTNCDVAATAITLSTSACYLEIHDEFPDGLRGDLTLRGKYKDDSGIRVGGWVIFGVGTAVGTGVMLVPLLGDNSSGDINLTPLFIGTGIVIGSAITSLIMILNADNPSVETVPTP